MNYIEIPKPVGYWQIGGPTGVLFSGFKRPRWLTRYLCRALLEIEWHDGEFPSAKKIA
jgi:hypothetical protein